MPQVGGIELTEDEIREFKEVFDLVDKDKGGTLEAEEVKELMELLGMKVRLDEVKAMVAEIDKDGSGAVDFEEFLEVMARPQQLPYSKADVIRAFRMFADEDAPAGCISPEKLEAALIKYAKDKVPEDEIMRLVNQLDLNEDGWINYHQKVNLFLSK